MEVVWDLGRATVSDVVEHLPGKPPLSYSTVLTTLRILERKRYLEHVKEGRASVYRPRVARDQAQHKAVTHLLQRFFHGSAELLMLSLVERGISREELERLRARIDREEP